jgi:alkanesulfonate monooxygenase
MLAIHWFLPTSGDSRSDLSLGNAVGVSGSRVSEHGVQRAPDINYLGQIARSAEQLGFRGALTPTSSWCEDAWVVTAGLTQVTERFRYLVAFRPGLQSPLLAAQMAATYQRISGGRLLLNLVTGGDDAEQRRFGDFLNKPDRYARAGEFLQVLRQLWTVSTSAWRARSWSPLRRGPTSTSAARRPRRSRSPRATPTSS